MDADARVPAPAPAPVPAPVPARAPAPVDARDAAFAAALPPAAVLPARDAGVAFLADFAGWAECASREASRSRHVALALTGGVLAARACGARFGWADSIAATDAFVAAVVPAAVSPASHASPAPAAPPIAPCEHAG
eukprot:1662189-Pleurochrysis_carterae.AAC.1